MSLTRIFCRACDRPLCYCACDRPKEIPMTTPPTPTPTPTPLIIKINQCPHGDWYKNRIGETMSVKSLEINWHPSQGIPADVYWCRTGDACDTVNYVRRSDVTVVQNTRPLTPLTIKFNKTHKLKIWPTFFEAVEAGNKTFECRKNDRDFATGDTLILKEYDPAKDTTVDHWKFTGRTLTRTVGFVMHGGALGIEKGYCVMGLLCENTKHTGPKGPA